MSEEYIYLSSLSIAMVSWIIGISFIRKSLKLILSSSILAIPQGFLSLMLVPGYWNPKFVTESKMGIEDLLFSFFAGGTVWIAILLLSKSTYIFNIDLKSIFLRFLYASIFGIIITFILFFCGIRNMENPFITMTLWIVLILILFKKYRSIVLFGLIGFTMLYVLELKIAFIIWPDLHTLWTVKGYLGEKIMGVPIGELIWAILYGASWTASTAYILDIQISHSKSLSRVYQ